MAYFYIYRLAAEALLEEAKSGARRAEVLGPSGWVKKKETINKRFLNTTVKSAVISNKKKNEKKKDKQNLKKKEKLDNR